jgi:hypothetical protein
MILAIGAVKRIDGSSAPAHTVSVEMIPVLRHSETSVTKATSATWPITTNSPVAPSFGATKW